jgi:hypothetical protein
VKSDAQPFLHPQVYKAVRRSDGEVVAVKVMECDKWAAEEANMLRGLDHECICKLYDFKLSEEEGASCLVMQYAAGGDLLERIVNTGPLTEKATASIAERLLRALEYMHSKGVIHRDLKPENVLYLTPDCDKPILADFGVGKRLSVGALHEDRDQAGATMTTHSRHIGTVGYCAPEVRHWSTQLLAPWPPTLCRISTASAEALRARFLKSISTASAEAFRARFLKSISTASAEALRARFLKPDVPCAGQQRRRAQLQG